MAILLRAKGTSHWYRNIRIENNIISSVHIVLHKILIKPISKVKKVVDCGDWYFIVFKFLEFSNALACQKDLITKGTIEEFEALFEGKIVRKI